MNKKLKLGPFPLNYDQQLLLGAVHKLRKQQRGVLSNVYACLRGGRGNHGLVYVDIVYIIDIEYPDIENRS